MFRKLEGMLQHEMDVSSTLRAELEELKLQHAATQEKEQAKIQSLQKYGPFFFQILFFHFVMCLHNIPLRDTNIHRKGTDR